MPELVNFEDWSSTSELSDPVDLKIAHADSIREAYFKEGTYNEEIAEIVNNNLYASLGEGEGLTAEQINDILNAPPTLSLEEKAQAVSRSGVIDPLNEDGSALRAYEAFLRVKESGEATPDYLAQEDDLRGNASVIIDEYYDDAVDQLRADGASPFVRVRKPSQDGVMLGGGGEVSAVGAGLKTPEEYYLKSGPAADGLTPYEAYRKSVDAGFLSPRDIRGVQHAMSPFNDGVGTPLHKRAHYEDAIVALNSVMKQTQEDPTHAEGVQWALRRYVQQFRKGRENPERAAELRAAVVEELEHVLPESGRIPLADRLAAIEFMAGDMAMSEGVIEFDDDNPENNIRTFGYGDEVIHGDLLAKKSLFESALERFSPAEQDKLRARRRMRLNGPMFADFNEVINRTYLSSEWNEAVAQGLLDEKEEADIFDEFFETHDYSSFRNETLGSIARSIPDAATDTLAALGVAATGFDGEPNEFALSVLTKNQRDREARGRLAHMMGDNLGMVTTLSSMITPVVVDLTATALLTTTTGVGGAAYLGAKTGARLTAKGITKGIVAGALKRKSTKGAAGERIVESTAEAAERLATTNLIKTFGKKKQAFVVGKSAAGKDIVDEAAQASFERATAIDVINKYNQVAGSKLAQYPSMFVPAATRSGGMTYASVYTALPDDMSSEEKHQTALGAGLTAATITGSLVVGFRAMGMGGLEDFIVARASGSQMTAYMGKLADLRKIKSNRLSEFSALFRKGGPPSTGVLDRAMAKITAEGVKRNFFSFIPEALRRHGRNYFDEAFEEGVDEFINSYVQSGATGQDMLFADRMKHAWMASVYGGLLGMGMPAARSTLGRWARGAAVEGEYAAKREAASRIADEINRERAGVTSDMGKREIAKRLRDLGSPATADVVEALLDERDRAQIREAEDEPKRVADPTAWLRDRMSDLSTETQRVEDPTAWLRDRMSDLPTATQRVEDPTAWLRDRMSDLIPPASPLADLSVPQILDIARAVEGREGEEQVLNEKEKAAVQFKAELEKGLADRAALTSPPPEGEFDETAEAAAAAGITDPEEALALLEEDFKREKAGKHAEAFAFFGLTTEATEDEVRAVRQKMVNEIFDSMAGPTTTRSQMEDIDKAHNLVEDYFAEQVLARVRGASPEEHEEAFSAALHEKGGETGGEPMSSPSAPLPLEVDPLVAIEETGVMPSLNTNQLKTLKAVLPSDLFERLVETKIPRATIPFRAMGGTPVTASEHAEIMQALLEQRDKLLADSPKGKLTLTALNRKLLTLGVVVRRSPRKGLIFGGTPIATKDVTEKSYEEWVTEAHDGIAAALTFESDVESTDTGLETAEEAAEAEEELVITEQDRQDLAAKADEAGLDSEETVQGVLDLAEDPPVEEEEELTGLVGMTERFARKLKSPADEAAERLRSGKGKLYSMVVPDLTVMVDLSTVMAYYVARWGADKVKAISDFFSHMEGIYTRKELEPHIPKIYKMAVQAVEEDLLDPELEAELDAEFGEELDAGSVAENKLRDTIRDTIHQHVRSGIPILITRKNLHGFPPETFSTPTLVRADGTRTRRWSMQAINATINTRIRRLYPVPQLSTAIKEARSVGLTEDQLRNLDGGYTNSGNYARYHHDTSLGIFNNNPANVATLLRQKMEVRIPDDYTITGKRKQYIDGKTKNINEAIITVERYDKQTGKRYHVAVDVVAPIAGDVFYKKSLVYNNPLDSDLSEYLEGVMQINRARGGWGGTYLNATLGRRTPKGAPADADTERVVLFDSARDNADDVVRPSPIAPLEDYYHKDYSNLVEGYPTTDFGKIVHRILQIGIPPKNKETATTARAMALSEIYVRVQNRTMFPEFLVTNAKVTVAKIGGETVEQVELDPAIELETLANLIDVDEMVSFTIPKGTNPLDVGGEVNSIENKAAFLLKYGFPNKKRAPKIKNTTASRTPVKDWAEITIRHYWANEVSQHLKHTQGRLLGQTISSSPEEYDIYAVIAEAGARARARLYARRGKTDPDAMFLSHDAAKEVVDFEVAGQDLATGQDIEQESLPTAPDEALAEAGGDPWAGAGMISDESDNEVATQNVKKSVEGFLKRRNTEKKSVAKGVTRPPVAVAALKRIIVAVEGDTAPPHILEETRVAPILEHILDVARTNSNNDGVVKSYAEAVAKEELVDDWAFVDLLQTFSPMLHPRRPRLTEDLAKKVLAKLGVNYAPSIFIGKKLQFYRRKNQRMVERLGLESGDPASVVEALQKMAGASRHKSHRLVAELLLKNPELISTVKFSIYDSPDGHAGKHTRFADGTQMVSINLSGFYGQGVESVLLHEYLHAFTVDLLAKPESDLTPKQRGAKKKLTDLYKQASLMEDQTLEAAHAMESIDEFVATIFSSATFQRTVKNTNRFRQIVDAILDLFGITDASFRDAFNDLVDFVSLGNSQEQTTYLGDLDTRIERAKAHYRGRQKPDFMRPASRLTTREEVGIERRTDTADDSFPDDPDRGFFKGWAHGSDTTDISVFDANKSRDSEGLGAGVYFAKARGGEVYGDARANYLVDVRLKNPIVVRSHLGGGNKNAKVNKDLLRGIADKFGLTEREYAAFKADMDETFYKDFNYTKKPVELVVAMGRLNEKASYYDKLAPFRKIVSNYSQREGGATQPLLDLFMETTGHDGVYATETQVLTSWKPSEQVFLRAKEVEGVREMVGGGRRYSPFAAETGLRAGDVLSPKQQEEFDALLEKSLGHIPPSVAVTMFDTAAEAADILGDRSDEAFMAALVRKDGETVPVIYVVRENLADALFERGISIDNELHLMGIMESLITEELAHVAEFRAIPLEELDALIDTYLDIELEHFVDEYTKRADLRQSMKEGIANNDLETKRQIVGEMLQRRMKKITRGYTTQEDIDFYESNPSALRIALRYLAGVFRRLYARYNLRKDNLELAVMVNRMATEIRYLANGGAAWARRMPFDPRDPDAGFNILTRRFDGSLKDIDKDTTPEDVIARFQGMFDVLELPMGVFKKGTYQGYKGWDALKHGNTDPRITELKKKERAFLNAAEKVGNKKLAEFEKIRATVPHIEDELISEATGTHENVQVDGDYRLDLRSAYMAWRARLKSQIESGEVDKKDWPRDAIIQKFHEMVRDPMKAEYARLKEDQRKRVDTARESIREISPELADSIMEVRLLVDAFSLVMKKTYGLEGKVMAKVDSQLGIYLTRNYRIFNEEGFRERMLADETTEAYTEAYDYLRGQWIKSKAKEIEQQARRLEGQTLPDGTVGVRLTKERAVDAAIEILEHKENSGDAVIHSMMSSYLRAMETRARGGAGYSLPTGVAKSMVGPLTRRRRVPPPLQKMMGVYGPEEGIQNIFRTYAIVSEMTAKQAFYNNITELGVPQSDEDSEAFVFTHEQLTARRGEINPEAYVNMRTGAHYVSGSKSIPQTELEASYDISYNMYVHEDMFNDMKQMFSPDISESNLSTSKKTLGAVGEGVRLLTGLALTMKTLGSVGFYMRNILGNLLFFGPAQGYWPQEMFKIMVDGTRRVSGTGKGAGSWFNQDSFDEYFAEVTSFNVIGTDLNASLIKDLLRKPDQISAALDELAKMNKWVDKARRGQKKLTAKAEEKILSRLKALSQAVDSFYKIGYYEMEKANILEAKRWDIENNTDSIDANAPAGYRALTDYDIKYMASTKVRRTAQSYVDALHIVEKIGKSGWTSLATPFLRFKTEVFRIAGNTWKMSKEERGSTNPVIQRRGRKRRNGIIRVIGGGSTALPLALKHVMGIGEEEEELLRGSAPEYKRFSTFFYLNWGGDLYSLDLTYVNPFAIGVDPMMRFIENASRGKFEEATEEAYGSLAQTFMEENIFLGSITDIWNNKRADTGGPVYEDGDGLKGFGKRLAYMYEQAFEPRTPGKLYRAAGKILTGGDTAPDAYRAPLRELLNEFIPAKPHKYEPEENFQRFLQRARDIRNRAATHRNILKSQGSLSEQQIRKGIREWIKVRREIDERIYSAYIGAQGLGLTQRQAKKIMSDKTLGMGKRRQGYLTKGRREREVLPPPFIRQVYALTEDEQVGRQRILVALDEISKSGTRIQALRMRE